MVKVDNLNLNITEELKDVLRQNAPKFVNKPVIDKKRNSAGDLVQKTDEDGNLIYERAVIDTHPFVYFDALGNFYFRVFRSTVIDGKEILVTNPNIKTKADCNLYGRGVTDDKGPILATLYAVRELLVNNPVNFATICDNIGKLQDSAALNVNIVFAYEGEEERGSEGFATALREHRDLFEGKKIILSI